MPSVNGMCYNAHFESQHWFVFVLHLKPLYGGWINFFNSKKQFDFPTAHKVSRKCAVMYMVPIESLSSHKMCHGRELTPSTTVCSLEAANVPSPEHRCWCCSPLNMLSCLLFASNAGTAFSCSRPNLKCVYWPRLLIQSCSGARVRFSV